MLILKSLLGAGIVILLSFLSKSKNYYIVGLVPLFPTFALIGHFIIAKEHSIYELKEAILFGIWSLIPYFGYLFSLYFFIDYFPFKTSIFLSIIVWIFLATILIIYFKEYYN